MNSVVNMLERSASRYPDKLAVWDEWGEITYAGLRKNGLSIGTALLSQDTRLHPVIVFLPKSIRMLSCFYGAMYSGNPYVPVDAAIPPQRLQYIISQMEDGHIITSKELAPVVEALTLGSVTLHIYDDIVATPPQEAACMKKVRYVIDTDPVYIMHTSGSTGLPKGVTLSHRGILDYTQWLENTFHYDSTSVMGNQSAFYFDNSVLDIYTSVRTGATMVIIPEILHKFPAKIPEFIVAHGIDSLFIVPTLMISIANSGVLDTTPMPTLKRVLFAGEVMPNKQLNQWRRVYPDVTFANLYGPTEITVDCTYYIVDRPFADTDPLPIGIPCENTRVHIMRPDGTEAAVGEQGEICVLGSGIARGYWKEPELTRKVFTQNPLRPSYDDRMYHTGDLGYVAEDGNIMFAGRADSQVKIHGNRVELGEAENAALSLPGIENACALFDAPKEEIVLFVQTKEDLQLRKLNLELKKILPKYMLPKQLVCMRELPLTPNGKIDRVTLKAQINK